MHKCLYEGGREGLEKPRIVIIKGHVELFSKSSILQIRFRCLGNSACWRVQLSFLSLRKIGDYFKYTNVRYHGISARTLVLQILFMNVL